MATETPLTPQNGPTPTTARTSPTPPTPPPKKTSRALWAILSALLIAGTAALLMRKGSDDHLADRPNVIQPIARNVPPPPTPPPASEELAPQELTFEPHETEMIGDTAAPGEVLAPATTDPIAKATTSKKKSTTSVAKPAEDAPLPEGDAEPLAQNEPQTIVTVEQSPEKTALDAAEAKKKALAEIEAELGTSISGEGGVEIVYREDIESLKTEELTLMIDGRPLTTKVLAKGDKSVDNGLTLFTGVLPAGTRNIQLRAKLRGDGDVFSYLKDYAFHLDHRGVLTVDPDKTTRLVISARESQNMTREWTDKFSLRTDVSMREAGGGVAAR